MRTLHLWSPPLIGLREGQTLVLSPEEHHHFNRVLRGKPGQEVSLMDGAGYSGPARCTATSKQESSFILSQDPCHQTRTTTLDIYGPVPKGKRFPYLLEKLQELGVRSFTPLQTEHSVREDWSPESRKRMTDRLMEACKQSRCLHLMKLPDATGLETLPKGPPPLVLDIGAPPMLEASPPSEARMLFGPEAGWSPKERAFFVERGWPRAGLSRQHLRMETAAILGAGTLLQLQEHS